MSIQPEPTGGMEDADTTRKLNVVAEGVKINRELATSTSPVLIVIRGTLQGKRYVLNGRSRFVLGRGDTADVQIDDANVSRRHVEMTVEGDQVLIADLGSRNGTYLNDALIGVTKVPLAKEDLFKVGNTILKYLPAGEVETLYHINIANAAHRDALTGLFNRQYLSEVLEVEFKRARALHTPISVVFFDIDDFKVINDTHGHACGDQVLMSLGAFMRTIGLGEHDLAGRYGGEEFLVVLSNAGPDRAAEVAEVIRRGIETHTFTYGGVRIPVTVSVGVATMRPDIQRGAELYQKADTALYESKRHGRNRVTVAS